MYVYMCLHVRHVCTYICRYIVVICKWVFLTFTCRYICRCTCVCTFDMYVHIHVGILSTYVSEWFSYLHVDICVGVHVCTHSTCMYTYTQVRMICFNLQLYSWVFLIFTCRYMCRCTCVCTFRLVCTYTCKSGWCISNCTNFWERNTNRVYATCTCGHRRLQNSFLSFSLSFSLFPFLSLSLTHARKTAYHVFFIFEKLLRVWGGYGQWDRLNYRSLLQNIVSFIGLFCKRDL